MANFLSFSVCSKPCNGKERQNGQWPNTRMPIDCTPPDLYYGTEYSLCYRKDSSTDKIAVSMHKIIYSVYYASRLQRTDTTKHSISAGSVDQTSVKTKIAQLRVCYKDLPHTKAENSCLSCDTNHTLWKPMRMNLSLPSNNISWAEPRDSINLPCDHSVYCLAKVLWIVSDEELNIVRNSVSCLTPNNNQISRPIIYLNHHKLEWSIIAFARHCWPLRLFIITL